MALGSSQKTLNEMCLTCEVFETSFTLGVFIAYLYKAMMLTTNVKIEMIKLIFSYFVIVPPPPIIGRDEPNNTLMTLLYLDYTTKFRKSLINFNTHSYILLVYKENFS